MATSSMTMNIDTLYHDLMCLCSEDETFYYKDIRLHSINYRIFNYHLCSYATYQSRTTALNCRGTMFNIMNPKKVQLVSLSPQKFFNYEEGFGRKQFHERGRLGDKMEKMDGALITTFLHSTASKEQVLRLKSKQSLSSKQAIEAMQLLVGMSVDDLARHSGLSKRNGVTFLTYYFRIILRNVRARKFVQAPFDAARHALFML
jgi:T4 RnlA family RNA ligase